MSLSDTETVKEELQSLRVEIKLYLKILFRKNYQIPNSSYNYKKKQLNIEKSKH